MNEFISKYCDFKIKDDKGLVYPLHITRALHQGCSAKTILDDYLSSKAKSETESEQIKEPNEVKESV